MVSLASVFGDGVPHPTGTAMNAEIEHRIASSVQAIGYRPEEQSTFICSRIGNCAQVHNLIVRIPGRLPGPAILVDAHYDSVAAGPGAADNGSGVAILLEIARVLKSRPAPVHPVILLFDDGEEQSLLGSQAFMERSPYAASISSVVNLDARGVRGPSMMFETSHNNAWLIRLYAAAVRHPVTNSLMYSLYQRLPSDTDFTTFRSHGIQGFNLAFIGGTSLYHRAGDTAAHTDARSVQHQGEEALALVTALATTQPADSDSDAVFFDVFQHVLWWRKSLTPYLVAATFLLLIAAVARLGASHVSVSSMLRGIAAAPASALLSLSISYLVLRTLAFGSLFPPQFIAHPLPYFVAFAALGIMLAAVCFAFLGAGPGIWGFLAGNWITWTALSLLLHLYLFGASYLFLVPALVAALTFIIVAIRGVQKAFSVEAALLVPACVAVVLWLPLLRLLYQGLGLLAFPVISFAVSTILLLILPLFRANKAPVFRLASIAAAVTLCSALVGILAPRYSQDVPFPLNLAYVESADSKAQWLFGATSKDLPRLNALLHAAPFHAELHPQTFIPWISSSATLFFAAAPPMATDLPRMDILSRTPQQGKILVHARLVAPQGVDRVLLEFAPGAIIHSMQIAGQAIAPLPRDYVQSYHGWQRYMSTPMPGGVDVQFSLDEKGSTDVYAVDLTYGLPGQGRSLLGSLPKEASASQDGHTTVRFRHLQLGSTGA